MGKTIILAGGGHAHMTIMKNSHVFYEHGHKIILISPSEYHYYSGMGPGMLSGTYKPEEIRFHIKKMIEARHGSFIEDRVIRIDPEKKRLTLKSGTIISYDAVSFNVGSGVPDEVSQEGSENVIPVKPILNLLKSRELIQSWPKEKKIRILVVGGGPAGVEVAANVHRLTMEMHLNAEICIAAGTGVLNKFPAKVSTIVTRSFRRRGIIIFEGSHVKTLNEQKAVLKNGEIVHFDIAYLALGVKPPTLFHDSEIPTDKEGGMIVNHYLQCVSYPEIFGGGDCISLEGIRLEKVGVYAVRQNPVLYKNLLAFAEGKPLSTFNPGGSYLLILNLGDGTGILWKNRWVLTGKLAFLLKDYIDNRFMKKFQVSGEQN